MYKFKSQYWEIVESENKRFGKENGKSFGKALKFCTIGKKSRTKKKINKS